MAGKILPPFKKDPYKRPAGMSPDPGYDSPPVKVERIKMDQPKYPADFKTKAGGTLGIGPAGKQFKKSEKYK